MFKFFKNIANIFKMIFGIFKNGFIIYKELKKAKKILKSNKYYQDIDIIPFLNWWKCSKGDLRYLWRELNNYVPFFFQNVFNEMYYQLEYIDLADLRKIVKANYFQNKYLSTKDIKHKRTADTLFAEIANIKKVQQKDAKMNDLIKFVQTALGLTWQIDATKISAGYFMSLYNDANKKLESYGYN